MCGDCRTNKTDHQTRQHSAEIRLLRTTYVRHTRTVRSGPLLPLLNSGLSIIPVARADDKARLINPDFDFVPRVGHLRALRSNAQSVSCASVADASGDFFRKVVVSIDEPASALRGQHLQSEVSQLGAARLADRLQESLPFAISQIRDACRIHGIQNNVPLGEPIRQVYDRSEYVPALLRTVIGIGFGKQRPAWTDPQQQLSAWNAGLCLRDRSQCVHRLLQLFARPGPLIRFTQVPQLHCMHLMPLERGPQESSVGG